jgi:maleylacetoacetate isomerase
MKLYGYFRSSAAYRVRIALNVKGLECEHIPVHLIRNGGEQLSDSYRALNPEGLVPLLVDEKEGLEFELSQSLAIIEYLEEKFPNAPLLPSSIVDRAYVRSLALSIACDIHPVNNLRILTYLSSQLGVTDEQKKQWYQHWCMLGLQNLESRLAADANRSNFCFGDQVSLADCCLIPQVFNALRFNCDVSTIPTIMGIYNHCQSLEAFKLAHPSQQLDAE